MCKMFRCREDDLLGHILAKCNLMILSSLPERERERERETDRQTDRQRERRCDAFIVNRKRGRRAEKEKSRYQNKIPKINTDV